MGVRTTDNLLAARRVIDMENKIALLEPSAAPLISILKQAKGKTVKANAPKVEWLEDTLKTPWSTVTPAIADKAETAIVMSDVSMFTVGDIVNFPATAENVLVTAIVVATKTLTVVRNVGSGADSVALANNAVAFIIGNAFAEGATSPASNLTTESAKYNFTQIFRTAFDVTKTVDASTLYGGKDFQYQAMKKGIEHKVDISRSIYFGQRKEDTTNSRRTMGGLKAFCTSNGYAAGGAMTQANFDANVSELAFRYGSKRKLAFCGAKAISNINSWALGKVEVQNGANTYGVKVMTYQSPFGELDLIYDPILSGVTYGGYMFVIDPENITYRPLRDTKLNMDIQANDADLRKAEYITEATIQIKNPETHAIITGIA